ncbi:unnamed protein product [Pseudo-nitzschia multistriata]|uniref:glucose-6-phosphate 1-epimerase n=1 Tax=Pseudo-nitzschia multistriata TaxID=183589 RepID=A0A448ZKG2_9STRA|nr:unnamed protein product [Pseudo-nitzschia multistriata]
MKFSLASIAAIASCASVVSAFTVQGPSRSSVVLQASRKAQKIASRTAWAESRGFDGSVATATAPAEAGLMKNDEGLEFVRLVSASGASSEIYLYGGVVTSFKDAEGTEFIAVRPDAKMDGSKPISGGLSHCWPQFGPGEIQQHGFARNVNWSVVSQTDTTVELEMLPSDYTKEMWDKEFACRFTVELGDDELKTNMSVKNTGSDDAFDFQAALHSYFTVSALENLEITGSFEGKEFLNKLAGDGGEMQTEERSSITITEEYDRVYKGVNDPVLKDTGSGKALNVVNEAGWEDTVLWNPYGDEGMGFNNFVCVESVKFDPVTLDAGASWDGVLVLKPESL